MKKSKKDRPKGAFRRTVASYKRFFEVWKSRIVAAHPKGHRFWSYCYEFVVLPWVLVFRWFRRNPSSIVIFSIWLVAVSSEVWVSYLMGLLTIGTDASAWWLSIASACWLFWMGPGTPFMAIVLGLTVATEVAWKKIVSRIRKKRGKKDEVD